MFLWRTRMHQATKHLRVSDLHLYSFPTAHTSIWLSLVSTRWICSWWQVCGLAGQLWFRLWHMIGSTSQVSHSLPETCRIIGHFLLESGDEQKGEQKHIRTLQVECSEQYTSTSTDMPVDKARHRFKLKTKKLENKLLPRWDHGKDADAGRSKEYT